jgi:hypothetical protein
MNFKDLNPCLYNAGLVAKSRFNRECPGHGGSAVMVILLFLLLLVQSASSIMLDSPVNSAIVTNKTVKLVFTLTLDDMPLQSTVPVNTSGPENGSNGSNMSAIPQPQMRMNTTQCNVTVNDTIVSMKRIGMGSTAVTMTLDDGAYVWRVQCDAVQSLQSAFSVHTTAPAIVLTNPTDNQKLQTTGVTYNPQFAFAATDAVGIKDCSLKLQSDLFNGSYDFSYSSHPMTYEVSNLLFGNYTWRVRCKDNVGISGSSAVSHFSIVQPDDPSFQLGVSREIYSIGEQGVMTVTANAGTYVQYLQLTPPRGISYIIPPFSDLPKIIPITTTNYTGIYTLFALASYNGKFYNYSKSFEVQNSIDLNADGDKTVDAGENINLTLVASGGISPYTYYWLENDSRTNGQNFNRVYNEPGTYYVWMGAEDAFANNKTEKITLHVQKSYRVEITVKNQEGVPLSDVSVLLDDAANTTDSVGRATFMMHDGSLKVSAYKSGYMENKSTISISQDTQLVLTLVNRSALQPQISLLTDNNSAFQSAAQLEFSVQHPYVLRCDLLVASNYTDNGSYFMKETSMQNIETSKRQSVLVPLEPGAYAWKVYCIDELSIQVYSEVRMFMMSNYSSERGKDVASLSNSPSRASPTVDDAFAVQLKDSLQRYDGYSKQQKMIADVLNMQASLENAITVSEKAAIDVEIVKSNPKLSAEEKQAKIETINARVKELQSSTLLDIQISEQNSFIRYPQKDVLEKILNDYYAAKKLTTNKAAFLKKNTKLQSNISVDTDVYGVVLSYYGNEKTVVIVVKNFQAVESGGSYLEYIPKTIAESSSELQFMDEVNVLVDDPLIEYFPSTETKSIVYMLNKQLALSELEQIETVYVQNKVKDSGFTGFVLFNQIDISSMNMYYLLIPGIILSIIILLVLKVPQRLGPELVRLTGTEKITPEQSELMLMMQEVTALIGTGNSEDAISKYNTIRLIFDQSSDKTKKVLLPNIMTIYKSIMSSVIEGFIHDCYAKLDRDQIDEAIELYDTLNQRYAELPDDLKMQYYVRLSALAEKINFHQLMSKKNELDFD